MPNENYIEFRVHAGLEQVRLVGISVRAIAEQFLTVARAQLIELCTVEIATNCVKHAYDGISDGELTVRVVPEGDFFVVEVRDSGKAIPTGTFGDNRSPFDFDPKNTDSLPEGGMGLALVSAMAEQSDYFRDDDENVMRMQFSRTRAVEVTDYF